MSRNEIKHIFNTVLYTAQCRRAWKYNAVRVRLEEFVMWMHAVTKFPPGTPDPRCRRMHKLCYVTWWCTLLTPGRKWQWELLDMRTLDPWFEDTLYMINNMKALRTDLRPLLVEYFPKELCAMIEGYNMDMSFHFTHQRKLTKQKDKTNSGLKPISFKRAQ